MSRSQQGIFIVVLAGGLSSCLQSTKDVTHVATPKYTAIAGKIYVTLTDLFLVEDKGRQRTYLFPPDRQDFPYDPKAFSGEAIPVSWGRRSFITDVISEGTTLQVEKVEYVSGPTMCRDVIYGRVLTPPHSGAVVRIESLFYPSDRSDRPILNNPEYLRR